MDDADAFVHAATRAFALRVPCPPAPTEEAWVHRAVSAGVLAPIARVLETSGHPVPEQLGRLRSSTVARDLLTLADLERLGRVLDEAGIAWAALKGPVLRDVVFEEREVRDFTDLDVLVAPGDIRRAVEQLLADGATLPAADWRYYADRRTAEMTMVLRHGTVLDLHWSLTNDPSLRDRLPVSTEQLLARRRRVAVGGVSVWTLDELDFVLHVIQHACTSGCSELRWLLDVQQAIGWLSAGPEELAARAAQWRITTHARLVLDAVATYLDPAASTWAAAMGRRTPWVRFLGALSRRRPPSTPSVHPNAALNWYRCTRTTGTATARAVSSMLGAAIRHRRGSRVTLRPETAAPGDPVFERWLGLAEAQSR